MKPTKFLPIADLPRVSDERQATIVAASVARPVETPKLVASAHLAALDAAFEMDLDIAKAVAARLPAVPVLPSTPTLADLVRTARGKLQSARTGARVPRLEAARVDLAALRTRLERP